MRVERIERARFVENVAGWDAALRFAGAALILLAAFGSLWLFDADWVFTLLLHPFILAVYLLATAVSRMEPLYHAMGWRTLRDPDEARAVRTRRTRGLRRTSP